MLWQLKKKVWKTNFPDFFLTWKSSTIFKAVNEFPTLNDLLVLLCIHQANVKMTSLHVPQLVHVYQPIGHVMGKMIVATSVMNYSIVSHPFMHVDGWSVFNSIFWSLFAVYFEWCWYQCMKYKIAVHFTICIPVIVSHAGVCYCVVHVNA